MKDLEASSISSLLRLLLQSSCSGCVPGPSTPSQLNKHNTRYNNLTLAKSGNNDPGKDSDICIGYCHFGDTR
jgi:hypothetical protein